MGPNETSLTKISSYSSILLSIFFIGLGVYYSFTSDALLTRYTKEDGFIEWMTFLIYFASFLLMAFVFISRRLFKAQTTTIQDLVVVVIGAVFLFGAMEEISWFQRIISTESNEFFMQYNRQQETNLHNMVVDGVSINRLIFGKLFFVALLSHNVIIPLLARKNEAVKKWFLNLGVFLPPTLLVVPYLILALSVDLLISHSRAKEHLEVLGSIHYFSGLFYSYIIGYGFSEKKELIVLDDLKSKKVWSIAFSLFIFLMTLIAWIMGNISLRDFKV